MSKTHCLIITEKTAARTTKLGDSWSRLLCSKLLSMIASPQQMTLSDSCRSQIPSPKTSTTSLIGFAKSSAFPKFLSPSQPPNCYCGRTGKAYLLCWKSRYLASCKPRLSNSSSSWAWTKLKNKIKPSRQLAKAINRSLRPKQKRWKPWTRSKGSNRSRK